MSVARASAGGIPILWLPPAEDRRRDAVAVWMTGLTGAKELTEPVLRRLAGAGYLAVSLDAAEHGERLVSTREDLAARADRAFRRTVWPILGRTVVDAMRVIDWAHAEHGVSATVAGGVSMGGDIAVALAGADPRVSRVAAIASTPDWTRPGMTRIARPEETVSQGEPGAEGRWWYERLDPMTHPEGYLRGPAILFEVGGRDGHIPAEHAERFRRELAALSPESAARIVVHRHEELDHPAMVRDPVVETHALAWLMG